MTPGSLPLKDYVTPSGFAGHVNSLRRTRGALEDLRTDVMHNRRPGGARRDRGMRVAVITNAGPNGEADDTTKNNYWCKFQRIAWDPSTSDFTYETDARPNVGGTVLAQNVAERRASHLLATDGTQRVLMVYAAANAAVPVGRWVFLQEPPAGVTERTFLYAARLAMVSGSNGTSTSAPTYVYDIHDYTIDALGTVTVGDVLNAAQTPLVARPNGSVTAATWGWAYRGPFGHTLFKAEEIPDTSTCE